MSTTAEATKAESKKPARKKAGKPPRPSKKAAPKASKGEDDGPMPGKKLLQSWVDKEIHEHFCKMAADAHVRPATFLRMRVHALVEEDMKARKEMNGHGGRS